MARFAAYEPPALTSLNPHSGPVRGGTRIVLHGEHLGGGDNRTRHCIFGALGASLAWLVTPTVVVCTSPPQPGHEGPVELTLTLNEQIFTPPLNFTFYDPPMVTAISPTSGPADGATAVQLAGGFSAHGAEYLCAFTRDSPWVPATRLTSTSLLCRANSLPAGSHALTVSLNGADFSDPGAAVFAAYVPPLLLSVSPPTGPIGGGTRLVISSGGSIDGSHLRCAFNGTSLVDATARIDAHLTCVAPPAAAAGAQTLGFSPNGQQFLHSATPYTYYDEPLLESLSPGTGPQQGGTRVVLRGLALHAGSKRFCRFGGATRVPLLLRPRTSDAMCVTPLLNGSVSTLRAPPLALTLNGQQFHEVALRFAFGATVAIGSVAPTHGPTGGGTLLRITGTLDGGDDLRCRFRMPKSAPTPATTSVVGATLNRDTLLCVMPPGLSAGVSLEVATNGQQYSQTGVVFHLYEPPSVSLLSPNTGPVQRGMTVTLHGAFGGGVDHRCRFEALGAVMPATLMPVSPANALLCTTPARETSLTTVVEVSLNGQQYTASGANLSLYDAPHVSAASPSSGPIGGATRVAVAGLGFRRTADLRCRFNHVVVRASFVSATAVACLAPAEALARWRSVARINLANFPTLRLLHGAAKQIGGGASNGSVALTNLGHFSAGSLLLNVHGALDFAALSFEVVFNLMIVSGNGTPYIATDATVPPWTSAAPLPISLHIPHQSRSGDGISFSFGDIAGGVVSERGAGLGLRVQLKLRQRSELCVLLGGHELAKAPLKLPIDEVLLTRIRVHKAKLTLDVGGEALVAPLPLPDWQPLRTWRMALGSRSSVASVSYEIHGLTIFVSAFEDLHGVPLEVGTSSAHRLRGTTHSRAHANAHAARPRRPPTTMPTPAHPRPRPRPRLRPRPRPRPSPSPRPPQHFHPHPQPHLHTPHPHPHPHTHPHPRPRPRPHPVRRNTAHKAKPCRSPGGRQLT